MTSSIFAAVYLDENVDLLVAAMLRAQGFGVVTTQEANLVGASDAAQLAFAVQQKCCLVTHNRDDFVSLHKQYINENREHLGIIVAVMRRPGEVAGRLAHLLDTYTADEIAGQLLYV